MRAISFKFSAEKSWAAIQWMLRQSQGLDLHTLLKACYFADKKHLNDHGRPIFGARYRAMKFGPVPVEIYEMAKGEPMWLAELSIDRYPWRLEGFRLRQLGNDDPDLDVLSDSDMDALRHGLEMSCSMTFSERTAATHGPDWQRAELGYMKYEDMIEETAAKAELVSHLREAARFIRL